MKQYYQQGYTNIKFNRVVTETYKAKLFEMYNVKVWIPNNWIVKLNKKSFNVKDHVATLIKLKLIEEYEKRRDTTVST
jgi:hypothetical protein